MAYAWQKKRRPKPLGLTDREYEAMAPPWSEPHVPDLDRMSSSELMSFWKKYHRPSRKAAEHLVGRRPGYTSLTEHLANYASNAATAMDCRRRGDEQAAKMYESIAERIFRELPADIRWR